MNKDLLLVVARTVAITAGAVIGATVVVPLTLSVTKIVAAATKWHKETPIVDRTTTQELKQLDEAVSTLKLFKRAIAFWRKNT